VELPPPSDELALAGERWCDVVHRRQRYRQQFERLSDPQRVWSIDDAITENLDMRELIGDYLAQLATAEECDTAFGVLRSLTICDPTVGSGAFLFAALEVLDPLYAALLGRAAELQDRHGDEQCAEFLHDARKHPSERYRMLKTLCLNNLYGVDLMDEAPEIAKLRLFLKLAAQVDDVGLLEPLPDLDFNIKTGNLLVGIADEADATKRLFSQRLDHVAQLDQVEATAKQIAQVFDDYIEAEATDTGSLDHTSAKQKLRAKLDAARNMADTLLHDMRDETENFEAWRNSHRPFHWFVEFPSVWRNGGFDVVIGNPPYIKTSLVSDYTWVGYKTEKCPDLYAVCMERATTLINKTGRFAMIVLHSICFSSRYSTLRNLLLHSHMSLWAVSFARIPDELFSGSARVNNTIILGKASTQSGLRCSRARRWLSAMRPHLFNDIEYLEPSESLLRCGETPVWPFLDSFLIKKAFEKLRTPADDIGKALSRTENSSSSIQYRKVAYGWMPVFTRTPPTIDPATGQAALTTSERVGELFFESSDMRDVGLLMLAGRWGYVWWLTYSDEFHVTRSTLSAFPGDIERLAKRPPGDMELEILLKLSRTLQEEMPKHLAWKLNAGVKVGRYNMLKLRYLTDKADWLLAKAWGLDEDAFEAAGNLRDRMVFGNKE